jgi:hypothetical protein
MNMIPSMSEADLQRLAQILQERGEGLAAINSGEAQLLKAFGGSGQALPGTQGMGPGGGPIRSYEVDKDSGKVEGVEGTNETQEQAQVSEQLNQQSEIQQHHQEYLESLEKQGSGDNNNNQPPPPPPPKYYDTLGNEYSTPEARDAANKAIDDERAVLATKFTDLKTDTDFEVLKAKGELPTFTYLSEDEVKEQFDKQMTIAADEGRTEVPRMVEILNSYLRTTDPKTNKYINFDKTYDQFIEQIKTDNKGELPFSRLSEPTMRAMWDKAMSKAMREEAFELTPQEVAEFERTAPSIAATDVADATAPIIGTVDDADAATVGTVDDPGTITVDTITALNQEEINTIGQLDDLAQELLNRIRGAATSPAQLQLKRSTEQNLKQLLGLQAGAAADPARIKQLRDLWMSTQQEATGQAAELRAQETIDAEKQLIEVYRVKGTMELQVELANLETQRQTALKNAEFAQARELAIQQTALTRVITQANLDTNVNLKNLETRRIMAVEQGKLDLATKLANLQKDLSIAQVNANLSLQSRAMDDAIAIAAYKGDMAAQQLEVTIDLATLEADLKMMGFELQRDLAELDAATQRYVAELGAQWRRESAKQDRDDRMLSSLVSLTGTALGTWAAMGSDIRMKKDISQGDTEVEGFLDALNAYQYKYRNPNTPNADAGVFIGISAQDMEKSKMGRNFVNDTPNGKMIDMNQGLAAILAGQANLNQRLRNLENGR